MNIAIDRRGATPIDRRDKLAELLTDADVETLRHMVNGNGRQHAAGARLRSRLSRGLVASGDRQPPAMAGAGSAVVEIRHAPSLGSGTQANRC